MKRRGIGKRVAACLGAFAMAISMTGFQAEIAKADVTEETTEEGRELKLQEQIRKKLLKNKTSEQIADELEEPLEEILPLCDQIEKELQSTT